MAKRRYDSEKQKSAYIKPLTALNEAQKHYLELLSESTVTFCQGPAGTGKTFLASHQALSALLNGEVKKVILTRPIVATEDIGYLPGDMNEKIHPYMLPLFDALEDHLGATKARELLADGTIEVLPLAYMRGRSLNDAYIILDEAQNTTRSQMKMFLTRLGRNSVMAINGDAAQSDLGMAPGEDGLSWAVGKLRGRHGKIAVTQFTAAQIVRNPLIEEMLAALDGLGTGAPEERTYRKRNTMADAAFPMGKPSLFKAAAEV